MFADDVVPFPHLHGVAGAAELNSHPKGLIDHGEKSVVLCDSLCRFSLSSAACFDGSRTGLTVFWGGQRQGVPAGRCAALVKSTWSQTW